jgi:hypothetical protein
MRVSTILSIGSGRPALVAFDGPTPASHELMSGIVLDCERVARELATQLFNVDAYLRLTVDRGMENTEMSDWGGLGTIKSHTETYLEIPVVTKAIDSSLQRLQDRVGSITLGQLSTFTLITSIRHSHSHRPIQWDQDAGEKRTSRITLFCSTEGVLGANEAASRHFPGTEAQDSCPLRHGRVRKDADGRLFRSGVPLAVSRCPSLLPSLTYPRYKHTFFIDASSISSIQSDLQSAIRSLGMDYEKMTFEEAISFLVKGTHDGKWLLIFDNANDPKVDLVPYFPECFHGTILITTHNSELGRLNTTIHLRLGPMGPNEAYETLARATHRTLPFSPVEHESARRLIEVLGSLAVALVQADSYCYNISSPGEGGEGCFSFEQYLQLFKRHRSSLMRKEDGTTLDRYGRGAYTTFDLSYSLLPQPARLAKYAVDASVVFVGEPRPPGAYELSVMLAMGYTTAQQP